MINYDNFIENLHYLEDYTNKKLMIVVKNNAYNTGLEEIVTKCIENGYDHFALTTYDEAKRARAVAPNAFILVLNPFYGEEIKFAQEHNITLCIPSYKWYRENEHNLKDINLHIKVNIGMNRFGFSDVNEINELMNENSNITGLYTHFPSADEKDLSLHETQLATLLDIYNKVTNKEQLKLVHAENSAALLFKDKRLSFCNIVRCGLIAYGYTPTYFIPELKSTVYVSTKIIHIQNVKAGENVGYGMSNSFDYDTNVAICPMGYGAGISKGRACIPVYINSKPYRVIAISMSHLFIEVDDNVHIHDIVEVFGDNAKIDHMKYKTPISPAEQLSMLHLARIDEINSI